MNLVSFTVRDATDVAVFEGDHYTVTANRRSCFFCEHCTDIWFDYTVGPYMFHCEQGIDSKKDVLKNGCALFEWEEE